MADDLPPRHVQIPKQTRDADGKPLCRWCKGHLPKGRRTFCSQDCVDEALIRTNPGWARGIIHKRDKGICACCGRDTDQMRQTMNRLAQFGQAGLEAFSRSEGKVKTRYGFTVEEAYDNPRADATGPIWGRYQLQAEGPKHPDADRVIRIHARLKGLAKARVQRLRRELLAEGFDRISKSGRVTSLWDLDHITEVVRGGGACGKENLQTLCQPCHKAKTKRLAAERAAERRLALHGPPPPPHPELALFQ